MSFENLGLAPALLSAVQDAGFSTPTAVQAAAIPQALAGHDLMVSSQTGSGKTAAFMLPALHRIAQMPANKGVGVQVLVLTPTRELALQVTDATATYGRKLADLRTATVVGGMPYGAQLKALSRRVDVLVATPGRLIDHLNAGRVKLNTVHTLVLDEADRMLDMGFIEDIETIIGRLPESRQTLLFSATLDGTVAKLAARMMREPQRIEIAGAKEKHTNITQSLLYADDASHKMQLLDHVLRDASLDQAIVFTSTKRGADDLADRLADQGLCRRRPARRHEPAPAHPHPDATAARPAAHPGGHRRGRPWHRRARHQPRRELRPADAGRGLRAPHRPHRPRQPQRPGLHAGHALRAPQGSPHRALHRPVDHARSHRRPGTPAHAASVHRRPARRQALRQAPRRRLPGQPRRRLPWRPRSASVAPVR